MAVFVNEFYEVRLEQLLSLADAVEKMFSTVGLDYRVVGGLATYFYVEEAAPDAGRLTRDIDIVVRRKDLEKIAEAAEKFGLQYRHASGEDMLVRSEESTVRRAVHLVFSGEKVRPDYPEAVPELAGCRQIRGIRLIPLADLIRSLITPEMESALSPILRERLAEARARG